MKVSTESYPLRIYKIESGSFLAKLIGHDKVIDLLARLIDRSVGFLHRNFTTEGKIAAIPTKVDSLNSVLGFSNQLQAHGVDVRNLRDEIAKGAVFVAQDLNKLLKGQPAVRVNAEVHSIAADVRATYLEAHQGALEDKTSEVHPLDKPVTDASD